MSRDVASWHKAPLGDVYSHVRDWVRNEHVADIAESMRMTH